MLPALALFVSAGTRVVVPALLLRSSSACRWRSCPGGGSATGSPTAGSSSAPASSAAPCARSRWSGCAGSTSPSRSCTGCSGSSGSRSRPRPEEGESAELSLAAVSRAQADALREALLGSARAAGGEAAEAAPLYRATPGLLALGGMTSLSYLLAPAAIVGVVFNLADDLPGRFVEQAAEAAADRFPTDAVGLALIGAAAVALVLAAAAAGSLLVDWDFTLRDEGERLAAVARALHPPPRPSRSGPHPRDRRARHAAPAAVSPGRGHRDRRGRPRPGRRDPARAGDPRGRPAGAARRRRLVGARPRRAARRLTRAPPGRAVWSARSRSRSPAWRSPPRSASGGGSRSHWSPWRRRRCSRSTAIASSATRSTAGASPCVRVACAAAGQRSIPMPPSPSPCGTSPGQRRAGARHADRASRPGRRLAARPRSR